MNLFYGIVLVLLIIITSRTINMYRMKYIKLVTYHFEKAKTEYIEPPRPYSKSYNELLRLLTSVHSRKQKELIVMLSQLIKDYAELTGQMDNIMRNKNLILLINEPKAWYRHYSQEMTLITRSGVFHKKDPSEIFYQKFIEILTEVQQVLGIPLISKME